MRSEKSPIPKTNHLWRAASTALVAVFGVTLITPVTSASADMGPAVISTVVQSTDFTGAADFEAVDGVLHPNGATYYAVVADRTAGTSRLLVIDTGSKAVTASLELNDSAGGTTLARFISIQPNGARLWVSLDETTNGMLLVSTNNPDPNDDGVAEGAFLAKILSSEVNRPGPVAFNLDGSRAFFATDHGNRSLNHYIDASLANPSGQTRIESSDTELWESIAGVAGKTAYAVKPGTLIKWIPGSQTSGTTLSLSDVTTVSSRPDGSEVWVARSNANLVERITVSGEDAIATESRTSFFVRAPQEIAFAKDVSAAVVVGDNSDGDPGRFSLISTDPTQRIDLIDVPSLQTHPVGLSVNPDGSVAYALYTDSSQNTTSLLAVETDFGNRTTPEGAPSLAFDGAVLDGAVCSNETLNVKEAVLAKDGKTLLALETTYVAGVGHSAVRLIDLDDLSSRVSCLQPSSSIPEGQIGYHAALDPTGDYLWVSGGESGIGMAGLWDISRLQTPQSDAPLDRWRYQVKVNQIVFRPITNAAYTEAILSEGAGIYRNFYPSSTDSGKAIPGLQKTAAGSSHLFTSTSTTVSAYPYTVLAGSASAVPSSTFTVGKAVTSLTVSPDDSELWVTVGTESRILVLNTADLTLKDEISSYLSNPQAVAFHPTEDTVIVADANGVQVFDATSKDYLTGYNIKTEQSLSADINTRSVVVSAAGDKVALVDINDGTYVLDYEPATLSTQSSQTSNTSLPTPTPDALEKSTPLSVAATGDPGDAESEAGLERTELSSEEPSAKGLGSPEETEVLRSPELEEIQATDVPGIVPPWLAATSIGGLFLLGVGASILWWRGRKV